ncbi:MAG: hypothetical protein M1829_002166 [Trizodia sp. TS-e1964]|nr:MAG: hypothetical protein M1829_002166 [Trizodia sp. TS-e1964]
MASTPELAESTIYTSKRSSPVDLRFLHFNDVYHVEPGSQDPIGGIARFQTVVNHYRSSSGYTNQTKLLAFFSGDAFNPSLESSVTKGRHMIPVLNGIGTDVACVGNHDLDFGVTQFRYLADRCSFPWLLANVLDPALGENVSLGSCQKSVILEASNGMKVGVIGLVEKEWLDTINSLPPNLVFKSASEIAKDLVPSLRAAGADIIVAVTHMREPNDILLAQESLPGLIDLILGGHDHYYAHQIVNGTHILRSGSDFKQLSYIEARRKQDSSGWDFDIVRRDITRNTPIDDAAQSLVLKLTSSLAAKLEKPIGYTAVPLDGRFTTVRTQESNLGNFICDLMRHYYGADCTMIASGTIRGDQIYSPGVLKLKDIMNCLPFEDPVVVIKVKGKAIRSAVENGLSKVPALEGRFPQVSNITFEYDASRPAGKRIISIKIGDKSLNADQMYVMATRGYMARGKDGYDSLLVQSEGGDAEEIVSEENGMLISMIIRQYFMSLKVLGRWRRLGPHLAGQLEGVHNQMNKNGQGTKPPSPSPLPLAGNITTPKKHSRAGSIISPSKRKTQVEGTDLDSDTDDDNEMEQAKESNRFQAELSRDADRKRSLAKKFSRKWMRIAGLYNAKQGRNMAVVDGESTHWTRAIAPRLENRIVNKGPSYERSYS